MFHNQRPGVYTRYELAGSGTVTAPGRAALVLCRQEITPGSHTLTRLADAAEFTAGDPLAEACLRLLFEGGAGTVDLVFYQQGEAALSHLPAQTGVVICDEGVPADAMHAYLADCATASCDCFLLTGRRNPEDAIQAAGAFAHERILLCGPEVSSGEVSDPLLAACWLGGNLLTAGPTASFSGREAPGLSQTGSLPEEEIQRMLQAGVCVFESLAGSVRLIRALSTSPDASLRSLSTVRIADAVMARIRSCLRECLAAGVRNPESIRDQVSVALMALREEGMILAFDRPICTASEQDPTCCIVELSFAVGHLVSRIHITARVRA